MGQLLLTALLLLVQAAFSSADEYLGCYKDSDTRILGGKYSKGIMTKEKCIQICSYEKELYAGLEFGDQCFCGSVFDKQMKLTENRCSSICTGNAYQKCGGAWAISVYKTNKYVGCYEDRPERILTGPSTTSDYKMTAEYCINYCKGKGAKFAMTEFAKKCFCGNHLKGYHKQSDRACRYKCSGAASEYCGGFLRGSVYRVQ